MPNFIFELTDKRYFYTASGDQPTQSSKLTFTVKTISRCNVQVKNKGPITDGDLTFYETDGPDSERTLGKIIYLEESDQSHTFSVHSHIPKSTFQNLLKTSMEGAFLYVTFGTNFQALQAGESGVGYGEESGDVVWDVEKEPAVTAESVTLALICKPAPQPPQNSDQTQRVGGDAVAVLVAEKIDELIKQITPHKLMLDTADKSKTKIYPEVNTEDIHKIAHLLNRIFWAIIVVGGLLAIGLLLEKIH